MDFQFAFVCVCGGGLIFAALFFNGLYLRNVLRGRKAHVRLAESGGYRLLNDTAKEPQKIFGGEQNGRLFAFRAAADTYRSSDGDGTSSVRVRPLIQIIFPLFHSDFDSFTLLKKSRLTGSPDEFANVWTATPDDDRLTAEKQQLLMAFAVENAHPAGFHWPSYRSKPEIRRLSIVERSKWKNSFPESLFANAAGLLIYDHPDGNIDLNQFQEILTQLEAIVVVLEK